MQTENTNAHKYVGMWVTADKYIRQELLPEGRYDEARGTENNSHKPKNKQQ